MRSISGGLDTTTHEEIEERGRFTAGINIGGDAGSAERLRVHSLVVCAQIPWWHAPFSNESNERLRDTKFFLAQSFYIRRSERRGECIVRQVSCDRRTNHLRRALSLPQDPTCIVVLVQTPTSYSYLNCSAVAGQTRHHAIRNFLQHSPAAAC